MVVDPVVLFRFSALTYNSHRIHYDRPYAATEGYDDLVIHGPLQVLLAAELERRAGRDLFGRDFAYKLVAPAIGPQTITARRTVDEHGVEAVVVEASRSGVVARASLGSV
jgi:3-methylfumaryl-CoA hydratase